MAGIGLVLNVVRNRSLDQPAADTANAHQGAVYGMMRLFVGLGLTADARHALHTAVAGLGVRGRLTAKENYHLTLAFLGDHEEQLTALQEILRVAAQECPPLTLTATGFGFFGRRTMRCCMQNSAPAKPLDALAHALRRRLRDAGEPFDEKPFAAHITLARQANLAGISLPQPAPVAFMVTKLTLYHSARMQGVLRYRPVFEAPFQEDCTHA